MVLSLALAALMVPTLALAMIFDPKLLRLKLQPVQVRSANQHEQRTCPRIEAHG